MLKKTLVTICIPVCYEIEFLKGSIKQIFKHKHDEIEYEIIICDQMNEKNSNEVNELYKNITEIKIIKIPRIDAGYPIDIAVRMAKGEYFCTLDADAFPISNLWLYLPIKLIEKYGFSFIGKESGLHLSYTNLGNYFHLNNYYRISKTDIAKKISEEIGFIRPQNKNRSELTYNKNINISCDNGVLAQWYSDINNMGPKLCLMMDKIIGKTPTLGVYGMIIDDLVFHMVFGQTNEENGGLNTLGNDYYVLNNEIITNGLTDEIIEKLISLSKTENILNLYGEENLKINGRQYYDNNNHFFLNNENEINIFIENIKNNF